IIIALILVAVSGSAYAQRYWPGTLTNWTLILNNGVAYISSSEFASHCSYSRGEIQMDGTEFNKAQYSYAMAAKAKGKRLSYVVDDTQTNCIITGLSEVD
ncbi:MAG: hypothetical protein JKY78_12375, partial [Hyphomonas sp.]|nr:hypothetical protein [Hyphomonas sp.]